MSEIEFLTLFAAPGKTVVYAGAAPGTHIAFLSDMFPEIKFILIDPAPFTVTSNDKIEIIQSLFTDEMATDLGTKYPGLLFISDVRSVDWELHNDKEVEEKVKNDMQMQQQWHLCLKPERSMLKFRLPWDAGSTTYLDGDIYLPVWGPVTTTETRLITKKNSTAMKRYDNKKYEQQLFYFNTVMRPSLYKHNYNGEGIDYCYDCRAEVAIITNYLKRIHIADSDMQEMFSMYTYNISRQIARNRKLTDPNLDPADRKQKIKHRQYIHGKPAYEQPDNHH